MQHVKLQHPQLCAILPDARIRLLGKKFWEMTCEKCKKEGPLVLSNGTEFTIPTTSILKPTDSKWQKLEENTIDPCSEYIATHSCEVLDPFLKKEMIETTTYSSQNSQVRDVDNDVEIYQDIDQFNELVDELKPKFFHNGIEPLLMTEKKRY